MAGITKSELATKLGCSKSTVYNAIAEMDLAGHIERRGKTDYLDDFAASAVSARIAGRFKPREEDHETEYFLGLVNMYKDAVDGMSEQLAAERASSAAASERHREDIEAMMGRYQHEIDSMQRMIDDERAASSRLRDEKEAAASEVESLKRALAAIDAAPFWKRGAIARRVLALPAPEAGDL